MEPPKMIDDEQILEKVETLVGKGTKVIDCAKSTSFHSEETLLVNGIPVNLNNEETIRIKKDLLEGKLPPSDILNQILIRAGIFQAPVELEALVNTKSSILTTEKSTVTDKFGTVLDERVTQEEECNQLESNSKEIWKTSEYKVEQPYNSIDHTNNTLLHLNNSNQPIIYDELTNIVEENVYANTSISEYDKECMQPTQQLASQCTNTNFVPSNNSLDMYYTQTENKSINSSKNMHHSEKFEPNIKNSERVSYETFL